jgi:1-acyl-sn-glycerol-3-phosphate acyltransferase
MNRYYAAWYRSLHLAVPILTRFQINGLHHIPRQGPVIMVSNHISITDPAVLIGNIPRHVHFIIKAELLEHPIFRVILPHGKPIPIRRGSADRAAMRQAEAYLRAGEVIGIFPEGTRNHGGATQEAHAGVVFLAQRTDVPITPIAISGTEGIFSERFPWYRRAQVRMTVGKPFLLSDLYTGARPSREELAQMIMGRVAMLLPPQYRGLYEQQLLSMNASEQGVEPQETVAPLPR